MAIPNPSSAKACASSLGNGIFLNPSLTIQLANLTLVVTSFCVILAYS